MNLTKARVQDFVEVLRRLGGSSGNKSLRHELGWEEEFYWKVQGQLISQGQIATGRGQGGSVRLSEGNESASDKIIESSSRDLLKEKSLYAPIKASIETKWINRFALDDVVVDETHSRGSKDTGGTFTRPDITAVGTRSYVYLQKRLEVITFEIKPASGVSVTGVLEAIAHREAAHRVYVIFATSRATFDAANDGERIMELAQKFGVGVILTDNVSDVESWEVVLDAMRHEPDPSRLDRFLIDLPGETMKKKLAKWKG